MSGLDQPLLLANSNYHVGHQLSVRIAEERGYFEEEGFTDYVYECRGLIPGPLEPRGLALVMKEHGVDIATAVNVGSILAERLRGAELYIVGGWRFTSNMRLFGRKDIADLRELRGKRIGTREAGGIAQFFIANQLRRVGVDPYAEVEWAYDASYGYGNDPRHLDALRSGAVDAMASQPPMTDVLAAEGFPLLLDPTMIYPGGRPDKVVVATRRTVEERGDALRAFFRGNIRAFWDMRNAASFQYLQDLEGRLRAQTHNDDERRVRIVSSVEKTEGWNLPIHGTVVPETLERVVEELVLFGELERALDVNDVLRQDAASAAYRELSIRPALQEAHEIARAAVAKYGF
jgi:ABC-type nitrate/sulfonate/bicarbonate transport system substrate-binding protein